MKRVLEISTKTSALFVCLLLANSGIFRIETKSAQLVCSKMLPRIKRAVTGQSLLPLDEVLRGRWLIKGLIGHGGYGEIYFAVDVRSAEEVAIKVEPKKRKGRTVKRMILEQKVLLRLQGRPHIPKMIASGHINKINFIVMQLLSVNIGDLKKASPVKRLGRSTVGRIMQQAVAALRDIHLGGYIHRDVKPANMCFGITPKTRHILVIVDFGLVRRFKNLDGTTRPLRPRHDTMGFRYPQLFTHPCLLATVPFRFPFYPVFRV
ncbi:unnamed protein product, partial [Nippostrongylus brasiliensis]|uniref:non-specific serine/threonine protein kinase n=1 Tax=Nippostrongylus brasiliensis TaxID=27835 RepID=A0A0N4XIV2_NIPBR